MIYSEVSCMADMSYSINAEKKILHCAFRGVLRAENLIEHINAVRSDKAFSQELNTIVDLREAALPQGFMEVSRIVNYINQTSHIRGPYRLSLVIDEPDQKRGALLYAALSPHGHVKICASMREAEKWVSC